MSVVDATWSSAASTTEVDRLAFEITPLMRTVGHIGDALILAAVAVSTLDEAEALWITATVVPASVLPDVDRHLPYVVHRGVIHAYSVMFLVSVTGGGL